MTRSAFLACAVLAFSVSARADEAPFEDALLDRLAGDWVLTGTIAGGETTHDISAAWVLGHQYLRLDEVSRETDDSGAPQYQATVFIGWDKPSGRYVCLWLDSTGGGGLANDVFGYAEPAADRLAFVFGDDAGRIHNTFTYDASADTWTWAIDNERAG
jgi:hypothetical protein